MKRAVKYVQSLRWRRSRLKEDARVRLSMLLLEKNDRGIWRLIYIMETFPLLSSPEQTLVRDTKSTRLRL